MQGNIQDQSVTSQQEGEIPVIYLIIPGFFLLRIHRVMQWCIGKGLLVTLQRVCTSLEIKNSDLAWKLEWTILELLQKQLSTHLTR